MDTNALIGALLRDLAAVQTVTEKRRAYSGAAGAVLMLDTQLDVLAPGGRGLPKIPGVGPSSARVIDEVLRTGGSPTVEQAVAASTRRAEVTAARQYRAHFLSRAEVRRVLDDPSHRGPRRDDYHGDFQMHSTWSDGAESPLAMARGCLARGYQFAALTDHAHGLRIARGMSPGDFARQHADIDAANRELHGAFRLLRGIEANIGADGSLDLTPDDLRALELVVAAPHSELRSTADQTARMLAAVRTPGVHILGHPRGRQMGGRSGIVARWDDVFGAAAEAGVAIEIDGDPNRQDVDFVLARDAVAAGCLIALDSDAHAVDELVYAEHALAHARLAGIPVDRIVNCWPLDRVLRWLKIK